MHRCGTFANAFEPQVHLHFWIHTLRAGFAFIQKKTCNPEDKALNLINCINEQLCKKILKEQHCFHKDTKFKR